MMREKGGRKLDWYGEASVASFPGLSPRSLAVCDKSLGDKPGNEARLGP